MKKQFSVPTTNAKYRLFLCLLFAVFSSFLFAQNKDEIAIRNILQTQQKAWSNGQLNQFMQGYWQNDSLMFIGKSGITYGWQKTLNNYKKRYPDTAAMGKLKFTLLHLNPLSSEYYFVVGKWYLTRSIGNIGGTFTLLFEKINGQWYIIADHSS
jgi:ketosteroid isomerase-like protein